MPRAYSTFQDLKAEIKRVSFGEESSKLGTRGSDHSTLGRCPLNDYILKIRGEPLKMG